MPLRKPRRLLHRRRIRALPHPPAPSYTLPVRRQQILAHPIPLHFRHGRRRLRPHRRPLRIHIYLVLLPLQTRKTPPPRSPIQAVIRTRTRTRRRAPRPGTGAPLIRGMFHERCRRREEGHILPHPHPSSVPLPICLSMGQSEVVRMGLHVIHPATAKERRTDNRRGVLQIGVAA